MNTNRLPIVLGVLVGFVGGLIVGTFLEHSPAPDTPTSGKVQTQAVAPVAVSANIDSTTVTGVPASIPGTPILPGSNEASEADEWKSRIGNALMIPDENERHAAWLALLPDLDSAKAATIQEMLAKMAAEGRPYEFEWAAFWPAWGQRNGAEALASVLASEPDEKKGSAAELVLRGWAKTNPGAARAWITANGTSPVYGGAVQGYVEALARTDIDRATSEALSLGGNQHMNPLLNLLADHAAYGGKASGLLDWWQRLPDETTGSNARRTAVDAVAARLTQIDPAQAQTWVSSLAGTPYRSDAHIGQLGLKLAQTDPVSAVSWVISLPPSPADGHFTAIGRTMKAWLEQDRPAATSWVNSLPASPLRDQAMATLPQSQAQILIDTTVNQQMDILFQRTLPR